MTAREDMGAAVAHLVRCHDRGTHTIDELVDLLLEDHVDALKAWLADLGEIPEPTDLVVVPYRHTDKTSGVWDELRYRVDRRPGDGRDPGRHWTYRDGAR